MTILLRFSLIYLLSFKSISATENLILAPGQRLEQNHPILSPNGKCQFLLQSDGNLVVKKDNRNTWISGSHNTHNINDTFFIKLQIGGALVIKRQSGESVFSTNTRNITLDTIDNGGGLYFNEDSCTISIYPNYNEPDVWTNIRRDFYSGNRLERGEMIQYPSINPRYTLLLQNDGNLIIFAGADFSDYHVPQNILWDAGITSHSDHFFLKFTCDGRLVLKEKLNNVNVPYWNMTVVPSSALNGDAIFSTGGEGGQKLGGFFLVLHERENTTLSLNPFGYEYDPTELYCQPGVYTP